MDNVVTRMNCPGQQFFRELLCVNVIVEAEDQRNVATVEGIYFFSLGLCEGIYAAEACWCVTRTAPW